MTYLSSGKKAQYYLLNYVIPLKFFETRHDGVIPNHGYLIDKKYYVISNDKKFKFSDIKKPNNKKNVQNHEKVFKSAWECVVFGSSPETDMVDESVQSISNMRKNPIIDNLIMEKQILNLTGNTRHQLTHEWVNTTWTTNQWVPNNTSKADFTIKNYSISYKHSDNCQLMSAEPNELYRIYSSVLQNNPAKPRILSLIKKVNYLLLSMRCKSYQEKIILKNESQKILDEIHNEHKTLAHEICFEAISGERKFTHVGKATMIIIKDKFMPIKDYLSQFDSLKPRAALPKGKNRPGNVKM